MTVDNTNLSSEDYKDASNAAAEAGDSALALELLARHRNHQLAQLWCKAERQTFDELTNEEREAITARIQQRICAGPGDLAVDAALLIHELRNIDDWQRDRFVRSIGDSNLQRLHVYDSFVAADLPSGKGTINLFGNANIGYDERSNLQVPGEITFSDRAILTNWYVTTVPTQDWIPGTISLEISSKIQGVATVTQLIKRPQQVVADLPPRCNVRVRYGSGHDDHKLPSAGIRVYVHLEGWKEVPKF